MDNDCITTDTPRRIQAALDWLCRSQKKVGTGGSAAYFAPLLGWSEAYPETSGYIIPTLRQGAEFLGEPRYNHYAIDLATWLVDIQAPEGWFPAGRLTQGKPRKPSIFNTGQIVFGLVDVARGTQESRFYDAAQRAVKWLVSEQDSDGRWRGHAYRDGYSPSYYAHVCWPLLEYWRLSADPRVRDCADRGLQAIVSDRQPNGSFSGWGFRPERPAFTHTIGYTLQGLVESARITGDWEPVGESAVKACEILLRQIELKHRLAGTYDLQWKGDYRFKCLTGNCQIAHTLMRVGESLDDPRFLNASLKIIGDAGHHQRLAGWPRDVHGAIPGSAPLYGSYMRMRYPNWAAKFFVDATISAEQLLQSSAKRIRIDGPSEPLLKGRHNRHVRPDVTIHRKTQSIKRVVILAGHESSPTSIARVAALSRMPSDAAELVGVVSVSPYSLKKIRQWRSRFGSKFVRRVLSELGLGPSTGGGEEQATYRQYLNDLGIRHRRLRSQCRDLGIAFHSVRDINDQRSIRILDGMRADIGVYSGAGILRKPVLGAVREGVVNAHCGPLPQVRGMNAVEWSLYFGMQPEVTLHWIDEGIDTGQIISSRRIPIETGETLGTLRSKAVIQGIELLEQDLPRLDSIVAKANPDSLGRQYYTMADSLKKVIQSRLEQGQMSLVQHDDSSFETAEIQQWKKAG